MTDDPNPYESPREESHSGGVVGQGEVRLRNMQLLPSVCMLCGEAAVTKRQLNFPCGTTGQREGKEIDGATFLVPLCARHQNYRWLDPFVKKYSPLVVGGAPLLAVVLGLASLGFQTGTGTPWLLVIVFLPIAMLVFVWVIMTATLTGQRANIRAVHFDGRRVVLRGVSPVFAEACREMETQEDDRVKDSLRDFLSGGQG